MLGAGWRPTVPEWAELIHFLAGLERLIEYSVWENISEQRYLSPKLTMSACMTDPCSKQQSLYLQEAKSAWKLRTILMYVIESVNANLEHHQQPYKRV